MKNRPTKETLIKFARRHALDIDGYYQDEKERDPHKREIDAIVRQLKAVRKQRDSFRKQRDELINDMAEVKRKAEAFDEIVKANDKSDSPEDFGDLVWGILMDYGVIHNEG